MVMTSFEPVRFGKYLLLDRIAVGGMAELYRAMITGAQGFEKLVAIKKLLSHLTAQENLVNAFVEEAKLAALLQHQNIVQIYDFGSMDGDYFIAMEHLFGKDLRMILEKSEVQTRPLGLEHILYIASRICEGLDYAHHLKDLEGNSLHIIHRDISPPNIFITYDGVVKIVDFGIAKAAGHNIATMDGIIKGKVAYMSPEQAGGEPVDPRSDIFSAGILLYEMLAGKRMYEGEPLEALPKVREAQFEPLDQVITDLPAKLYEILNRALAKDPEERYQSSGEMLSDLEACMHENDLRPTTRGLARYMKTLFKEEITAEERVLRETLQVPVADESETQAKTLSLKKMPEKTDVLSPRDRPGWPQKRNLRYGALGLIALIATGTLFILLSNDGAVSTSERPALLTKGPSGGERAKTGPVQATPAVPRNKKPAKLQAAMKALQEGRFHEAVLLFEALLDREPALKREVSAPYAQALVGQATQLSARSPKKAESLLLKGIQWDPRNVQAHFQLGLLYMRLKDYAKATEVYQKVAELDPSSPEAFFNLAYVYYATDDYGKAEEMYGRVVALEPPYLDEALFNLAMVQERQGKRAQSIVNLKKALRANPNNKMAKKFLRKFEGDKGEGS